MTYITLTEAEQKICQYIAAQRGENDRSANVVDARVTTKRTSEQIDLDGAGAEFAFCRLYNVYPDLSTEPRRGSFDCKVGKNRIDVKQNPYESDAYLIVKKTKSVSDCDIYVLMVGTFPKYRYAGWMRSTDVINERNLKDWGYAGFEAYSIPEEKLNGKK